MHHIKSVVIKESIKKRHGKGFSREEIKKAGLDKTQAKKLKIPIDPRRNTTHEENIKTLKSHTKKSTKPSDKAKAEKNPKS